MSRRRHPAARCEGREGRRYRRQRRRRHHRGNNRGGAPFPLACLARAAGATTAPAAHEGVVGCGLGLGRDLMALPFAVTTGASAAPAAHEGWNGCILGIGVVLVAFDLATAAAPPIGSTPGSDIRLDHVRSHDGEHVARRRRQGGHACIGRCRHRSRPRIGRSQGRSHGLRVAYVGGGEFRAEVPRG